MGDVAVRVENIGKKYLIGHQVASSLGDKVRGFFDRRKQIQKEEFWALKAVSFEINKGEAVGIIGKNGAGKSTLLKILSRITHPTEGSFEMNGRVSSLLEVGTGFHPELSGRENIFLNGTILGMSRQEIKFKFDEIVAFSGIEKFLDTPVKHYSSGMHVRLAFSVAAHLEPEILIIDEVLAVGDAEFQKKCLGKMNEVTKQGRTVLFVSHNMGAIESFCQSGVFLKQGRIQIFDEVGEALRAYSRSGSENTVADDLKSRTERLGKNELIFSKIEILDLNEEKLSQVRTGTSVKIRVHLSAENDRIFKDCRVSVSIHKDNRAYVLYSTEMSIEGRMDLLDGSILECMIDAVPLTLSDYYINLYVESDGEMQDFVEAATSFNVETGKFYATGKDYPHGWEGRVVLSPHKWKIYHA